MDKQTFRQIAQNAVARLNGLTGAEAIANKNLYLTWGECIGKKPTKGFKFTYDNKLFEVIQGSLTIEEQWIPGQGTESLYAEINEENAGTLEDPIPYNNNMQLYNGKYYSQDGVVYLCNRDTEIPVYNALKDLIGLYVEVVE